MKRIIGIILCAAMCAGLFCACGAETDSGKLNIVTTIFSEYDWVKNIIGEDSEKFELTMLLDSGVDLHSFQPTADDIIKISTCDLFIYVGGESDEWVDDALKEAANENMIVIDLLDVLGEKAKTEETVEGMEAEEAEEEEEEPEIDEHVWLSVRNAQLFCEEIKNAVIKLDSENAQKYEDNTAAYAQKLAALDGEFENAVNGAENRTLLFGDRFPFRYLVDDYSLSYYAAFAGCSAESEAAFETIKFLADKVDELKSGSVIMLEGANHKIAQTVVSTAKSENVKILTMDSMQSVDMNAVKSGASYLDIMEKNLAVLKEALK